MRSTAAVVLVVAFGAAASVSSGASHAEGLRLVDRAPLTIAGRAFQPDARILVSAFVNEARPVRRWVSASDAGTFRVEFTALNTDRCDAVRVVAKSPSGSAMLKLLKQAACPQD